MRRHPQRAGHGRKNSVFSPVLSSLNRGVERTAEGRIAFRFKNLSGRHCFTTQAPTSNTGVQADDEKRTTFCLAQKAAETAHRTGIGKNLSRYTPRAITIAS